MIVAGASSILYGFSDAVAAMRSNIVTSVFSIVVAGFALAIFAVFIAAFANINAVLSEWGDETKILIYVKDGARSGADVIRRNAMAVEGVREAAYVSKAEALSSLKKGMEGHEDVLQGVDEGVLQASIEIRLDKKYLTPDKAAAVISKLEKFEWAGDVEYGKEWVEKISAVVRFFEAAAAVFGVFFAAASIFIISNTIRLAVYARKDEIEVMKYLGATDRFIRIPFVIEGMIEGFLGGVLAIVMLVAAWYIVRHLAPAHLDFLLKNPFSPITFVSAVLFGGLLIGGAGSILSLGRFLKV